VEDREKTMTLVNETLERGLERVRGLESRGTRAALKAAVALNRRFPDQLQAQIELARLLWEGGHADLGARYARSVSRRRDLSARAKGLLLTLEGKCLLELEQDSRAATTLRRAVALDSPMAPTLLGVALCRKGQYGAAGRVLSQAWRKDPGNDEPLYNLGVCQLLGGRPRRAASTFVRVLELVPEHAEAAAHLAWCRLLVRPRDEQEISALLLRARERDPVSGWPLLYRALADAWFAAGRSPLAPLAQLAKRWPDSNLPNIMRFVFHLRRGNRQRAPLVLRALHSARRTSAEVRDLIAACDHAWPSNPARAGTASAQPPSREGDSRRDGKLPAAVWQRLRGLILLEQQRSPVGAGRRWL